MFDKYRAVPVIKNMLDKYAQYNKLINDKRDGKEDKNNYKVDSLINIFLEVTNLCNMHCSFCTRENMQRKLEMINNEIFLKAINSLPSGSYITLTGNGEPLLNKDLYQMIKQAANRGMFVSINTNASALNAENRIKLMNSGISRVQFSFQSIDKQTNETIMKGSKFDRELMNILEFIYLIRKENFPIYISISRVNYDASEKYAELTRKFWHKLPIDNYYEGALLSLQTDSNLNDKIVRNVEEKYQVCANPWAMAKVNANGDVNLCPQDFSNKYSIGNINENDLMTILNSEKAMRFRKDIFQGNLDELKKIGYCCGDCNTWTHEVKHGINDYIEYQMPVHLSLLVNEICAVRPNELKFLEKALDLLKNRNDENFVEMVSRYL